MRLILSLSFLLLTACSNFPVINKNFANQFNLKGRFFLKTKICEENQCKNKSYNLGIAWQHNNLTDKVVLTDPFHNPQITILADNDSIILQQKNQPDLHTTYEKMQKEIGLFLPIDALAKLLVEQQKTDVVFKNGVRVELTSWQGNYYRKAQVSQDDYFLRLLVEKMD